MKKNDIKFFKKARKVALLSDYKKVHIGCVAVYQGQIIGIGCNLEKTHPIQAHYNIFRNSKIISEYNSRLWLDSMRRSRNSGRFRFRNVC